MKKYLFIVLLVGFAVGQDIMQYDGKELKGEYIDHDEEIIQFHLEGRDLPSGIPFDTTRLEFIKLNDGSLVDIRTEEQKERDYIKEQLALDTEENRLRRLEEQRIAKEAERIVKEEKEKCEENKKLIFGVLPFKNDIYGITEEFIEALEVYCFQIDKLKVLEWFDKNNIILSNANDYHLYKAKKELKLDRIFYGYIYTDAKESNYTPRQAWMTNTNDTDNIFYPLIVAMEKGIEKNRKALDAAISGTWIYGTVFYIDPESGEKVFVYKNRVLSKL